MKPGRDPSPPETPKKAGAAEQMRNIKDLRKKSRSRAGAAAAGDSNLAGAHHLKGTGKSFIFQLASCDHCALAMSHWVYGTEELFISC
jgi:hypothetical protein